LLTTLGFLIHLIGKKLVYQFFTPKGLHSDDTVVDVIVSHLAKEVVELVEHNGLLVVFFTTNKSAFDDKVGFFYLAQLHKVVECHGFRF
jgi:hypothetical protein